MGDLKTNNNEHAPPSTRPDRSSSLSELLQRYLDEVEALDADTPVDAAADAELITPDPDAPGDSPMSGTYAGLQRTTTGVVALMRERGNDSSADLLETLRETEKAAEDLLNKLKDLHKKRTGTYPSVTITRTHKKPPL